METKFFYTWRQDCNGRTVRKQSPEINTEIFKPFKIFPVKIYDKNMKLQKVIKP